MYVHQYMYAYEWRRLMFALEGLKGRPGFKPRHGRCQIFNAFNRWGLQNAPRCKTIRSTANTLLCII